MHCTERITAKGSGLWSGQRYDLELLTVTRSWTDEAEHKSATVTTYALRFRLADNRSDVRSFPSEEQRQVFLAQSFTDLHLAKPPGGTEARECLHLLQPLIGEPLSAVIFVMDYLQLQFGSERLSAYIWPIVRLSDRNLRFEDLGYRDALCSLITSIVSQVDEYLDAGIVITFDRGKQLIFPLNADADSSGPDLLEYGTHIWSQGDVPFV